MLSDERQREPIGTSETMRISLGRSDYFLLLWRSRRKVAIAAFAGMMISLAISFATPDEYHSTVRLMPPENNIFSGRSEIGTALLGGNAAAAMLSSQMASSYLSGRTAAGTLIGVLSSRTVLEDIVRRFDLRSVYHRKLDEDARKDLLRSTVFTEEKKSGLVDITVTDKDPYRARDIAQAYIDEVTKLTSELSSSSAGREREFLDGRLKKIQEDLDAKSKELGEFSSRNATVEPEKQAEATLTAGEKLGDEVAVAQAQLSGLTAIYSDDNVRVRAARNQVNTLQKQLASVTGTDSSTKASTSSAVQGLPSVRQLSLLGLNYYQIYRQVQIEQTLFEALTKEDEAAKLEEAEQIVPIKVLDAPVLAERRNSKHVVRYTFIGMMLFLFFETAWLVAREYWRTADESHLIKAIMIKLFYQKSSELATTSR